MSKNFAFSTSNSGFQLLVENIGVEPMTFPPMRDALTFELNPNYSISIICSSFWNFVENIGVEPMTSCVQGRRSSQLS